MEDRLPPQNIEVERAVLGAMLIEPEAFFRGLELLEPDSFYQESHAKIFKAMKTLAERDNPADLVTVADQLHRDGELERIGGRGYLASLTTGVVTSGNLEYHAEIVREKAILRRLIQVGGDIVAKCYTEHDEIDALLDDVESMILQIGEQKLRGDFNSLESLIGGTWENLEEARNSTHAVTGVSTGFSKLDDLTSGLHGSDYIVIAARPSLGKTSLALGMALNVAIEEGAGVAIFSLEMAAEQLVIRLMANKFRVNAHDLRTGRLRKAEFTRIGHKLNLLANAKIFIDDTPSLTVLDMKAKCRRLMKRNKIGLLVVDYIQLITTGGKRIENRQQEITLISRQLKALARELDIPVIALSQLSRAVETRENKRPILADLRESGAIEQDADVVMFINRPEVHGVKTIDVYDEGATPKKIPSEGVAEIILAKQRNGPIGSVFMAFHKEYATFEDLAPTALDELAESYDGEEYGHGGT
jgi:replicative DNA helicase